MGIPADVRTQISSQKLTRSNATDSNLRTLVYVAVVGASLFLAIEVSNAATWTLYWVVASLFAASAYAAVHEAIHGSLYRSSLANDVAGLAWGMTILNPYAAYRSFHYQHHVYTRNSQDSEPVVEPRNKFDYIVLSAVTMVGLNAILWRDLALVLVGRPTWYAKRTARRGLAVVNVVVQIAFLVLLWFVADGSLLAIGRWWFVPSVIGSIMAGTISFPEHYRCARETGDPFRNSRTIHTGPFMRFIVWNANYHTAHHLAPTVTGRNLPQLQETIDSRCLVSDDSYFAFHRAAFANVDQSEVFGIDDDMADVEMADDTADYDARAGHRP